MWPPQVHPANISFYEIISLETKEKMSEHHVKNIAKHILIIIILMINLCSLFCVVLWIYKFIFLIGIVVLYTLRMLYLSRKCTYKWIVSLMIQYQINFPLVTNKVDAKLFLSISKELTRNIYQPTLWWNTGDVLQPPNAIGGIKIWKGEAINNNYCKRTVRGLLLQPILIL
jgi:hypothetical protein